MEKQNEKQKEKEEISEEALDLLEKIEAATEKLGRISAKFEEDFAQKENAKAQEAVGGETEASTERPAPKEETPEEYKDKVMKGEV